MVVDDGGRLVGVVSEGDLIRATLPRYEDLIREGAPLSSAWELFLERGEELRTAPISRIMIDKPIVFKPTDDLVKVASVMIMRQIHMLPVVEGGLLVGTISRGDVCHAVLGER
jgi:CBS domain-containing protein